MSKITHLSAEWHEWIVQNLACGCAIQSLIDDMVRGDFDPALAQSAVHALAGEQRPERSICPPSVPVPPTIYFKYTNSHVQVDPRTLHAGAPVGQGEKWIVTKRMRQRPYGVVPDVPAEPLSG